MLQQDRDMMIPSGHAVVNFIRHLSYTLTPGAEVPDVSSSDSLNMLKSQDPPWTRKMPVMSGLDPPRWRRFWPTSSRSSRRTAAHPQPATPELPSQRSEKVNRHNQVTGCEYYMSINFLFLWWVLCSKCVAVRSENAYEALALYKTKPCDEWDATVAEERKLRFTLPTSHVMSGNWHLDEGEIYSLTLTV